MLVNSEKIIKYLGDRIRNLEIENAVLRAQIDGFAKENEINYEEKPLQKEENVI